jgi:hypothetical protein
MAKAKKKTAAHRAKPSASKSVATAGKRKLPRARNAYQLLDRVCKAIEREPQRFNQSDWCGTAFCRAGWMVVLHDGKLGLNEVHVGVRAEELLDMDLSDSWSLFSTYEMFNPAAGARPGTVEYAKAGVDGTRAFMKKHAAHLKARSLEGV